VPVSFVDVAVRAPAPGELRRFSQRFGAPALLDSESTAYREGGLAWLRLADDQVLARLAADHRLLRLPLVRFGNEVTIGLDEATWGRWHRILLAGDPGSVR